MITCFFLFLQNGCMCQDRKHRPPRRRWRREVAFFLPLRRQRRRREANAKAVRWRTKKMSGRSQGVCYALLETNISSNHAFSGAFAVSCRVMYLFTRWALFNQFGVITATSRGEQKNSSSFIRLFIGVVQLYLINLLLVGSHLVCPFLVGFSTSCLGAQNNDHRKTSRWHQFFERNRF